MFATDTLARVRAMARPSLLLFVAAGLGGGGLGLAAGAAGPSSAQVTDRLKSRLPNTAVSRIDCGKIAALCEVTAGASLFYVDPDSRYLIIGRVYDMETRQDLTAARLLEINPDMLLGGAAKANAGALAAGGDAGTAPAVQRAAAAPAARNLSLAGLPGDGAIVWGKPGGETVTVFTDFRCSYCRALAKLLKAMDVRVVERPISVLGSREIAERVYCASNREAALHDAYAGVSLPPAPPCDTSGLDANERFAKAHGINGTPVIVRSDGAMLEGYRPQEFLLNWLKAARS